MPMIMMKTLLLSNLAVVPAFKAEDPDQLLCAGYGFTWCQELEYDISQPTSSIRVTCVYKQEEQSADFGIAFSKNCAAWGAANCDALSVWTNNSTEKPAEFWIRTGMFGKSLFHQSKGESLTLGRQCTLTILLTTRRLQVFLDRTWGAGDVEVANLTIESENFPRRGHIGVIKWNSKKVKIAQIVVDHRRWGVNLNVWVRHLSNLLSLGWWAPNIWLPLSKMYIDHIDENLMSWLQKNDSRDLFMFHYWFKPIYVTLLSTKNNLRFQFSWDSLLSV